MDSSVANSPVQDDGLDLWGETTTTQCLRLALATGAYAIDISNVREILEVGAMTVMPQTPPLVRGVINMRGMVVPVIDLNARFGGLPSTVSKRSCIVVTDLANEERASKHVVGILVDSVYEVLEVDSTDIEPVPQLGTRVPPEFLRGMMRVRGQICPLLDLHHAVGVETLTNLIAET
mgnify:CR=1 FL=1